MLLGVRLYMNVSASGTNLNIQRHTCQRLQVQHDFATLHGLCMLKVSKIYVLVVEVTRHIIRNVIWITLLSLRSTVSRLLEDL